MEGLDLAVKLSRLFRFRETLTGLAEVRIADLARIRSRAIRRGVWFKALSRIERGILDLTIKVTDKVRSQLLLKTLRSIVKKLLTALESKVTLWVRKVGRSLAKKLSLTAERWGNISARKWAEDKGFIQYLAVMKMNGSP